MEQPNVAFRFRAGVIMSCSQATRLSCWNRLPLARLGVWKHRECYRFDASSHHELALREGATSFRTTPAISASEPSAVPMIKTKAELELELRGFKPDGLLLRSVLKVFAARRNALCSRGHVRPLVPPHEQAI